MEGPGQFGLGGGGDVGNGAAASTLLDSNFPPPPVFGFARDDSINLEDVFTDWFNEDNLNGPPTAFGNNQGVNSVAQPQEYPSAVLESKPQAPVPQQRLPQKYLQPGAPKPMGMMPVDGKAVVSEGAGRAEGDGGVEEEGEEEFEDDDGGDSMGSGGGGTGGGGGGGARKKRPRGGSRGDGGNVWGGSSSRRMTEEQKVERRERNREHAKRSRVRKKFLLESLQKSVNALQEENDKLRGAIRSHLKEGADDLLKTCEVEVDESILASDPCSATKILDDPDYTLVKALQTAQQNFVITDPTLPDNPIVYASGGFLSLTGYQMDQILGRNCRFLQGPDTDPAAVDKIRRAIEDGTDGSVCLLNYRADGSTFWNQFFIAALRGADGNIVNYVGVQCKVSEEYASEVLKKEATSSTVAEASSKR